MTTVISFSLYNAQISVQQKSKKMTTKLKHSIGILIALFFVGCSQERTTQVDELLEDTTTQNKIMETISMDHELMNNMINHITHSDQAIHWMESDTTFMQHMMRGDQMKSMMRENHELMKGIMQQMMGLAATDSTVCKAMGEIMMGDEHMMRMMQDMAGTNGELTEKGNGKQMHMQHHKNNN